LDAASERVVTYASAYGLPLNVVFFRTFHEGGNQYLTRRWLIDPVEETPVRKAGQAKKPKAPWNGQDWCVSFGVGATAARQRPVQAAAEGAAARLPLSRQTLRSSCSKPPRSDSSSRFKLAMSSALAGSASSVGCRSATIVWSRSKLARISRIRDWVTSSGTDVKPSSGRAWIRNREVLMRCQRSAH
jgi:hypothetical protein